MGGVECAVGSRTARKGAAGHGRVEGVGRKASRLHRCTKSIDQRGIADISNQMGAFTVVRAASHEAAAKLFENHPHFAIFPGESVEVMPILPIPGG
jgi:hypothetical protein